MSLLVSSLKRRAAGDEENGGARTSDGPVLRPAAATDTAEEEQAATTSATNDGEATSIIDASTPSPTVSTTSGPTPTLIPDDTTEVTRSALPTTQDEVSTSSIAAPPPPTTTAPPVVETSQILTTSPRDFQPTTTPSLRLNVPSPTNNPSQPSPTIPSPFATPLPPSSTVSPALEKLSTSSSSLLSSLLLSPTSSSPSLAPFHPIATPFQPHPTTFLITPRPRFSNPSTNLPPFPSPSTNPNDSGTRSAARVAASAWIAGGVLASLLLILALLVMVPKCRKSFCSGSGRKGEEGRRSWASSSVGTDESTTIVQMGGSPSSPTKPSQLMLERERSQNLFHPLSPSLYSPSPLIPPSQTFPTTPSLFCTSPTPPRHQLLPFPGSLTPLTLSSSPISSYHTPWTSSTSLPLSQRATILNSARDDLSLYSNDAGEEGRMGSSTMGFSEVGGGRMLMMGTRHDGEEESEAGFPVTPIEEDGGGFYRL